MDQNIDSRRLASGSTAGIVGIAVNVCLAVLKLVIGIASGSVAILADAVNNIGDILASTVTVFGYSVSRKLPDKEHPFGHARAEYISGLFISILIIIVAIEFFISSVKRIYAPEPVVFSAVSLGLLILAAAAKLLLGLYYRSTALKINSGTLRAAAFDSFSDMAVTFVASISYALSLYTTLPIDGFAGVIVACIILAGGVQNLLRTISPLLGSTPDPGILKDIVTSVMEEEAVLGVHDAVVHDYGPGHISATIHAELDAQMSFADAHAALDRVERIVREKSGIDLVIHGDPIAIDKESFLLRMQIKRILQGIDVRLGFHDMQIIKGKNNERAVSFHTVIPYSLELDQSDIRLCLTEGIRKHNPDYAQVLIQFDHL